MSFLAVMAFLRGVPKVAWYALAGVALVAAAFWYVNHRERVAVNADRAERRAQVTETELGAERIANANDEGRRVVRERLSDKLDTAREEAILAEPEASEQLAGPATRAVLRELRAQQNSPK